MASDRVARRRIWGGSASRLGDNDLSQFDDLKTGQRVVNAAGGGLVIRDASIGAASGISPGANYDEIETAEPLSSTTD